MSRTVRSFRAAGCLAGALAAAPGSAAAGAPAGTATPITRVVVIFQENVSFDHYFATYPVALNPPGEPAFVAAPGTPTVNGLSGALLTHNPNSVNPFRLGRSQAATCDQDHEYTAEQQAVHGGLMDRFVEFTGARTPGCQSSQVMAYFDGNTVTALWNYAQRYSMSDNFFDTGFGPSTPGHINLVSGQTHGIDVFNRPVSADDVAPGTATMIGDPQPYYDDCSTLETVGLSGRNVGDLLNAKGVTWGWFQGGFRPTATTGGRAACGATHTGSNGQPKGDYIPHHEPFQYYASTSNPHHLPPSSVAAIGRTDQANHQYDLSDFWDAASAGALPAVSFLKAPGYQDGHAGYSDPLAEQTFLVETINRLQRLPDWGRMAIFIAWDDSDGWYDHVMPPIVSRSNSQADALTGPSIPGAPPSGDCGVPEPGAYLGRCGYGQRLPLLVVSPYAKVNFVDHTTADTTSILRFIEDNWGLGRIGDQSLDEKSGSLLGLFDFRRGDPGRRLILDPKTGARRGADGRGTAAASQP